MTFNLKEDTKMKLRDYHALEKAMEFWQWEFDASEGHFGLLDSEREQIEDDYWASVSESSPLTVKDFLDRTMKDFRLRQNGKFMARALDDRLFEEADFTDQPRSATMSFHSINNVINHYKEAGAFLRHDLGGKIVENYGSPDGALLLVGPYDYDAATPFTTAQFTIWSLNLSDNENQQLRDELLISNLVELRELGEYYEDTQKPPTERELDEVHFVEVSKKWNDFANRVGGRTFVGQLDPERTEESRKVLEENYKDVVAALDHGDDITYHADELLRGRKDSYVEGRPVVSTRGPLATTAYKIASPKTVHEVLAVQEALAKTPAQRRKAGLEALAAAQDFENRNSHDSKGLEF